MQHIGTQEIKTERLLLRRFQLSDASDMFNNYGSHEQVTTYLSWPTHQTLADTNTYLQERVLPAYQNNDTYRWAIVWQPNQQVIGSIDVVRHADEHFRAELGWVLSDDCWGQGIMPEAARAVLDYLFKIGYRRIQALHASANQKSGRVMSKIGMQHEGTLRQFINLKGQLVDCELWAITK